MTLEIELTMKPIEDNYIGSKQEWVDHAISFTSFAQSKVAHINTTELVASMPEMNDAKAELEKLAKTYETDIQTMAAELQSKVKKLLL